MCGIAGLVAAGGLDEGWDRELELLARALRHRGPDDDGWFTDRHDGEVPDRFGARRELGAPRVAFAHRRLTILDLSEAARQPMVRARGRVFLTYNGEVYNYRELRRELEASGAVFRTQSDTEVVLEAYLKWGIAAVKRLRGIFALAIADLARGKVFVARDHLGVKPLYLARLGRRWAFASELKALCELPDLRAEPDLAALRSYLHYLWIPGERTGLAGVAKVAPGTWIELDLERDTSRVETYWTPFDQALVAPSYRSPAEAIEHLRAELARVVTEQMVSDVPVGAFLSGGLDSSLVVALMQRRGEPPVSTYSVGYAAHDLAYDIVPDDLPYAREVGARFGTRATEIVLSPDVASLLPTIVETLDEPLGDPAAISSYLVCQAAKPTSTVMLSGMGADEVFAGYPRQRALRFGSAYRSFPRWIRRGMQGAVHRLPGAGRGALARLGRAGHKLLADADRDPLGHYIAMETYFSGALQHELLAPGGALATAPDPAEADALQLRAQIDRVCADDPVRRAILWDLVTYLPSLNLAYTDRTSMAHGVEVRVPLLDIRLVEWSLGARAHDLIRWRRGRLHGKWLLKQAARAVLPERIVWRPKAGFGAPVRSWLRGALVDLREELLGPRGLGARGWFDAARVRRLQDDFLAGKADHSLQIWMLMSLELWARRFVDRGAARRAG